MGCHFLLQRIFPTQGSNQHLLHWRVYSLSLSHLGKHYLTFKSLLPNLPSLWQIGWKLENKQKQILVKLFTSFSYKHFRIETDFNTNGANQVCVCMLNCSVVSTLCDRMDCSLPGSSVHGILQARILEWVAILLSRGSSPPRNQTRSSALQADSLPAEPHTCIFYSATWRWRHHHKSIHILIYKITGNCE